MTQRGNNVFVDESKICHAAFLRALAKPASVYNGMIHHPAKIAELLTSVNCDSRAVSFDFVDAMKENFVDLGKLLCLTHFVLHPTLKTVMDHLAGKCVIVINPMEMTSPPLTIEITKEADMKNGRFLNGLTRERVVPHYKIPTRGIKVGEQGCQKKQGTTKNLGPGTMTNMCPHGLYLGK